MKKIKNEKTSITQDLVKFRGDTNREIDYKELIELCLDFVPQGGFSPKDIRNRNRIQDALDKADKIITLEDADFENMENIIKESRWMIRHHDLNIFLERFSSGFYKKEDEEETLKKNPK